MSDFTQTMAQMISRARTPQAQGGGGGQRFFPGSGGGMGIKGNRTRAEGNIAVDVDQVAKKLFGHMTPEMKDEAFKKMQVSWERMVADDPEQAEMWRKSKKNQQVLEKLYTGGFPIKQLADGTFSTGIRSPEQRAYDDPEWSMERGKAGLYNLSPNERALRGYNTQTPTQNQTTTPTQSMSPTRPHKLESTGGPVRPHRVDQQRGPAQAGMAGMAGMEGNADGSLPFSERVRRAEEPYLSPHTKLMKQIEMKTALVAQENQQLGIKRDTSLYEMEKKRIMKEHDFISYNMAKLEQKDARELKAGYN